MNEDFVNYIWPHAVAASEATGVDPRIIAGQAAIESGWGQHFVGNNLLGIKGPGVVANTREINGAGQSYRTDQSFRSYETPGHSISGPGGYADFINTNPRYRPMQAASGDINAQLTALQRSGYSPDPGYSAAVGQAAGAIDGVIRKTSRSAWSDGKNAVPTDIETALGYTGQEAMTMPTTTKAKEPESSFFADLGIDPKGGQTAAASTPAVTSAATTTAATSGGSDFFRDLGIVPSTGDKPALTPADAAPSGSNTIAGVVRGDMGLAPQGKPKGTGAYSTGLDQAAAFGIGAVDGIPIAGPYLLEAAQRGGAAVRALANNIPYSDALAQVRGINQGVQADNPGLTTAGNVAGAVGSFGAGAAMGGAKLLGMAGRLPVQMAYGAGSGAAIGTADSAVRGENMLTGGAFGAAGGFAGPAVGKLAGAGVNKLVQGAQYAMPTGLRGTGISPAAADFAGKIIAADDPNAIRSFLAQHGPLATIADAGPSSLGVTGSLVSTPGAPKSLVTNMLTDRAAGTVNRLTGDIDRAIGPAPVPSQVRSGIESSMDALGPDYRRAMSRATSVDTTALANRLDGNFANLRGDSADAVRDVRRMLNIPGTNVLDPHPQALLSTRQAIDGMLEGETNSKVIAQLSQARQAVDAELTRAVPGIKDVDAKFQELARQKDALAAGPSILDSGRTAPRPQEVAQSFPASANPEGTLIGPSAAPVMTRQGVRGEIDRLIGTRANDLQALKGMLQGEGGWNTNKLTTVFGQEPTNQLLGAVGREAAFANTTQDVLRNSLTSSREAGRDLLKETAPGGTNLIGSSLGGIAAHYGKKAVLDPIIRAIMESPTAPRNLELAQMMVAQGARRDQILDALTRMNQRRSMMETGGNMLTGTVNPLVNMLTRGASTNGDLRRGL